MGGPKGVGGLGALPHEKKIRVFKFWCLKWSILTEITVKYGKYFNFFCQQGGGYPPPCGAEWGVRTPPDPPPPLAGTLGYINAHDPLKYIIIANTVGCCYFQIVSYFYYQIIRTSSANVGPTAIVL